LLILTSEKKNYNNNLDQNVADVGCLAGWFCCKLQKEKLERYPNKNSRSKA